jgi:signal transduction histidine kinase
MNQKLQNILDIIQQSEKLDAEQKDNLIKAVKDADKELEITAFKLERTEKVKKTTAILLEETIEELEQKREAVEKQNRELEIETALERVRARTMAMQHSSELQDASDLLFKQVLDLGVPAFSCGYNIWEKGEKECTAWMSDPSGGGINPAFKIPLTEDPNFIRFRESKQKKEEFYVLEMRGERMQEHYQYLRKTIPVFDEAFKKVEAAGLTLPETQIHHLVNFDHGNVMFITLEPCPEAHDIFKRFGKVFEQTYTRFLDLKKAEAQAREAQIEAALERVRSRTMGMQRSDELQEAALLLFQQVEALGVPAFGTGFNIWDDDRKYVTTWVARKDRMQPPFKSSSSGDINLRVLEAAEKGESLYVKELGGEALRTHYEYMMNSIPVWKHIAKKIAEEGMTLPTFQVMNCAFFSHGWLLFITYEAVPNAYDIFKRFAKVFEQTYTRFLDLQKAEAQAREAQIEAALEKVRSRSLAMHSTNELGDVVTVIVEKLKDLGVVLDANGIVLCTYFPDSKDVLHWIVSPDFSFTGSYMLPYFDHPIFNDAWQSKESGVEYFSKAYTVEEKNSFFEYAFEHSDYKLFPDEFKQWVFQNDKHILSFAWQKNSAILIPSHTGVVPSEDDVAILKRFAKVFEQSYVRFLDLQKAEIQAREAQIEAALERVRSRTMGMQQSDELQDAAIVLFQQVEALGVPAFASGFNIWDDDRKEATAWMVGKDRIQPPFKTSSSEDIFLRIYEAAERGESLFVEEQEGKALKAHYAYMNSIPIFKEIADKMAKAGQSFPNFQIIHCAFFSHGYLMFISFEPVPSYYDIFKRFAKVFEQTYTRFLDLQKAEAQAREAVKQASLDRVRGKIASMRTAEDLNRITPIIWNELKTLEVPFIRCGVFIIDEEQGNTQVYLTTPEGKSLGVLNLSFDANELTTNTVEYWKKKQVYKEHWNKEEFINWTKSMMKLGQVQNAETYQGSSTPPESLNLHFVPFTQGMLYVGDVSPLTDEKLDLVKTLAEAFSIAYARYEDFRNLEEAKNKIELTLRELKSAQAQLVHSEKMASLGELTAGIAHEIKNPLNFVNNFSEISSELLDEVKVELEKNDKEEVLAILKDLKQNLEKINQHGKRADSIVKGMLLHSRGTSGERALTNINDLLDQYVNLAYHGMRAQDKEFNITIEKDYDETLEKINVVPQDISRVFLNIINNACYAAYDRKKKSGDINFSPTLKVSTKKLAGKAEIRIGDNGGGIPKNILDKIFQPFFTTKPTGEGTGLGLSLSYDIVTKVHGGELKVESEEGRYTEFIIEIPKDGK